MPEFLRAVMEAFKRLLDRGILSIDSIVYDGKAFGNAVVVFSGRNRRVRVIHDRGDVFSNAASKRDPDDWFPLQRAIRAAGVSSPPPEGLLTPELAADLVERYFTDLDTAFGRRRIDHTKKTLAELDRIATERFMNRAKDTEQDQP